jgi:hypothetical protein
MLAPISHGLMSSGGNMFLSHTSYLSHVFVTHCPASLASPAVVQLPHHLSDL